MKELLYFGAEVDLHDPIVDVNIAKKEYGINLIIEPNMNEYHSIIIAVPHDIFKTTKYMPVEKFGCQNTIIFDLKDSNKMRDKYWTL